MNQANFIKQNSSYIASSCIQALYRKWWKQLSYIYIYPHSSTPSAEFPLLWNIAGSCFFVLSVQFVLVEHKEGVILLCKFRRQDLFIFVLQLSLTFSDHPLADQSNLVLCEHRHVSARRAAASSLSRRQRSLAEVGFRRRSGDGGGGRRQITIFITRRGNEAELLAFLHPLHLSTYVSSYLLICNSGRKWCKDGSVDLMLLCGRHSARHCARHASPSLGRALETRVMHRIKFQAPFKTKSGSTSHGRTSCIHSSWNDQCN